MPPFLNQVQSALLIRSMFLPCAYKNIKTFSMRKLMVHVHVYIGFEGNSGVKSRETRVE